MRKSKYSDEQMVKILREADEHGVDKTSKKHGVSRGTIYAWRRQFEGMEASDVKAFKALKSENARLKRLLAEQLLANEVLKEVNAKKW